MLFWTMLWMAPPRGYQEPPCGPVMKRSVSAEAGVAVSTTKPARTIGVIVRIVLPSLFVFKPGLRAALEVD